MSLLKSNFDELVAKIKQGREFTHASFEPIYYLVFSPDEIVAVKRQKKAWLAKLKTEGWNVREFSVAEQIETLLNKINPAVRKMWEAADKKDPLNFNKVTQSITNNLTKDGAGLKEVFENFLLETEADANALILVTDLEALHPYMRIGSIESGLQGKFNVPTVFLYPGVRTGKTRLKFLGFYPEDGNYRSLHVGG
ncbi:BREX protein BrxB domain-containing protein [Alteromonas sp. HB246098]